MPPRRRTQREDAYLRQDVQGDCYSDGEVRSGGSGNETFYDPPERIILFDAAGDLAYITPAPRAGFSNGLPFTTWP